MILSEQICSLTINKENCRQDPPVDGRKPVNPNFPANASYITFSTGCLLTTRNTGDSAQLLKPVGLTFGRLPLSLLAPLTSNKSLNRRPLSQGRGYHATSTSGHSLRDEVTTLPQPAHLMELHHRRSYTLITGYPPEDPTATPPGRCKPSSYAATTLALTVTFGT